LRASRNCSRFHRHGLGGYLAAKTDLEHYRAEEKRELLETQEKPEREADEVGGHFPQLWHA